MARMPRVLRAATPRRAMLGHPTCNLQPGCWLVLAHVPAGGFVASFLAYSAGTELWLALKSLRRLYVLGGKANIALGRGPKGKVQVPDSCLTALRAHHQARNSA